MRQERATMLSMMNLAVRTRKSNESMLLSVTSRNVSKNENTEKFAKANRKANVTQATDRLSRTAGMIGNGLCAKAMKLSEMRRKMPASGPLPDVPDASDGLAGPDPLLLPERVPGRMFSVSADPVRPAAGLPAGSARVVVFCLSSMIVPLSDIMILISAETESV